VDLRCGSNPDQVVRDNIDQAARHGVRYVADPGGSIRNHEVEAACAEHNIVLTTTGIRLFLHRAAPRPSSRRSGHDT